MVLAQVVNSVCQEDKKCCFAIIVFRSVNSSFDDDTQSFNLSIIRCYPVVVSDIVNV